MFAADDNAFLESLNGLLEQHEVDGYRDLEEEHPTVHVLGVPRSGTTLALQLLVAHTDVAYVDHVTAAFWRAPATGLRLSETLRRNASRPTSYSSDYGRTGDLAEPHEFHYLWARLLGMPLGLESLAQPAGDHVVDWDFFRRVVTNMCDVVGRPIVFKSFHAIWHLAELVRALPRTVVVLVRRDPLAVAQSLVKMREQLYGTREQWASIKPREFTWLRDEDYATQIAGQIAYVSRAIAEGIEHVSPPALVEVSYEEVCTDPSAFVARVVEAVEAQGGKIARLGTPAPFEPSRDALEGETVGALRDALARFELPGLASDAAAITRRP